MSCHHHHVITSHYTSQAPITGYVTGVLAHLNDNVIVMHHKCIIFQQAKNNQNKNKNENKKYCNFLLKILDIV